MGDVDADPLATELVGCVDGGAATAEGVEDDATGIRRCSYYAFEQCEWLLGGIAQSLSGLRIDGRDVSPRVLEWSALHLIQVTFVTWYGA